MWKKKYEQIQISQYIYLLNLSFGSFKLSPEEMGNSGHCSSFTSWMWR